MSEENKDIKDVAPLKVAGGKRKKGILFALAAGLLFLIATVFMILVMPNTADARKVEEQLKLGAKYLSELNYEQAIAAYQAAIEIEPKCTEAYLGLADIYTELGEFAKAEEILAEAKKYIEDEEEVKKIEEKEKEVEEVKETNKATEITPMLKPTVVPTLEPTEEAKVTPTLELTVIPTQELTDDLVLVQEIGKAAIGDFVTFGTYEQDNDRTNGAEAIEWQVLDKRDGKVLLLSKYALDAKPYHETDEDVTWETCTLRSWLNGEFYNTAFQSNEQKYIANTYVVQENNSFLGTDGGSDTYDKVFLLSTGEATTYFDSDPDAYDSARRVKVTDYAMAQGGWWYDSDDEYYENGWWWLRTPGSKSNNASGISPYGFVFLIGGNVNLTERVVRPALWIEVEAMSEPTATETPEPTAPLTSEATATLTPEPTATLTPELTATPTPELMATATPEPTLKPTAMPTPTSTPKPTATPIPVQTVYTLEEIGKAGIGDYVMLGSYEQDNNLTNGAEAIEWQVLDKKDGKVLLLSKYGLDAKSYHEKRFEDVTWEMCTLRSWLNGEFYNIAFNNIEQKHIVETYVINEDNLEYGTDGGNDTYDKLFLLSTKEAITYFKADLDVEDVTRSVPVTEYAKAQGCWYDEYDYYGNGWWWLRSPGLAGDYAVYVYVDGSVENSGNISEFIGDGVHITYFVVRPALWITVEPSENLETTPTPQPTAIPTSTPTPKPTSTSIPTPTSIPTVNTNTSEEIEKALIGDYVTFGSYEQDNNMTNGTESIEWQVLDKKDGKVLLLSKYALDVKMYNDEWEDVTWENCTLRNWLNQEFYNTAFTDIEQKYITETYLINENNPLYDTAGGNNTYDKVFLLSIGEVTTYFDSDSNSYDPARRTQITEYAKAQGGWYDNDIESEYYGNGWWWLRSSGLNRSAMIVISYGHVNLEGNSVTNNFTVVRPALWIEVE